MRARILGSVWLAIVGLVWLVDSGCFLLHDYGSLNLTPSREMNCGLVELPGEWWRADPELEKQAHTAITMGDLPDEAEFRLSSTSHLEILVAMRASPGFYGGLGSFYSSDKYGFQPGHKGIRTVDEKSWRKAEDLKRGKKEYPDGFYQRDASYQGKTFPRTGQFAFGSDISEHGRWIAVYSYDGRQIPKEEQQGGSIAWPGKGPDPLNGTFHIAFYNVASGRKVGALDGAFRGKPFGWYLWGSFLADRYYVIGTRLFYRNFWLCELPAIENKE
jgi:hypothetical protein